MSKTRAYRLKNVSVYVGLAGYTAMIASGNVVIGAWSKLIAECLRIPYYRQTDANDMAGLSVFFIVASLVAITMSFLP
jgi:hypothetical protein